LQPYSNRCVNVCFWHEAEAPLAARNDRYQR